MKRFLILLVGLVATSVCYSAPTYTSYFNNTHTYTNATVVGTNFAGRGVFTNGLTAGASTFTGEITSTLGSISADASALDSTATWNNAAVTFTGLKMNITDTASDGSSVLMDLQIGGSSRYVFFKNGNLRSSGAANVAGYALSVTGDTISRIFLTTDASGTPSLALGPGNASRDTFLLRDAANTLAMRNGANAQGLYVYNTFTDSSNYERGGMAWAANVLFYGTSNAGTGVARETKYASSGALYLRTSGGDRWQVNTSGHFLAAADNTYDIGASGATRPRNVYVAGTGVFGGDLSSSGGNVIVGNGLALVLGARSKINSTADGNVRLQNNAGTDFGSLLFGGATASFPALKRSSTELQTVLADDSGFAPHKASVVSATKAFQSYQGSLTHAGTVTLDFDATTTVNSLSLTGDVTFALSNLGTNRTYRLRINNPQATNCTVTLPANTSTNFLGGAPTTITAGKVAMWSMEAWGAANADVISAWAETQ